MNFSELTDLKQARHRKIEAARAILDKGKESGRALTHIEESRFDGLMGEAERMEREIALGESELEEREREELRRLGWAAGYRGEGDVQLDPRRALERGQSVFRSAQARGWDGFDAEVADAEARGEFQIFRALVTGTPRNELERRALSEGVNAAGGFTVPTPTRAMWIDAARERSVLVRAGTRTVPLESEVTHWPSLESDPSFSWTAENSTMSSTDATFGRRTFDAYTLRGLIRASRELAQDSPEFEGQMRAVFARAMAVKLDQGGLVGASTSGGPGGIMESTSVQTVLNRSSTSAPGILNWNPLISAAEAIANANLNPGRGGDGLGAIMAPRSLADFGRLTATDGQPMQPPSYLDGLGYFQTASVPTNLTTYSTAGVGTEIAVADWRHYVMGLRLNPIVEILVERYAERYQIGILGALRADFVREYDNAFVRVRSIGLSTFA